MRIENGQYLVRSAIAQLVAFEIDRPDVSGILHTSAVAGSPRRRGGRAACVSCVEAAAAALLRATDARPSCGSHANLRRRAAHQPCDSRTDHTV